MGLNSPSRSRIQKDQNTHHQTWPSWRFSVSSPPNSYDRTKRLCKYRKHFAAVLCVNIMYSTSKNVNNPIKGVVQQKMTIVIILLTYVIYSKIF